MLKVAFLPSCRDLLPVIQKQFRQFLRLRYWGWFSIIQKTKPLIGVVNIEEEIRELEAAATKAQKAVQDEQSEKKRLEEENVKLQVRMECMLETILISTSLQEEREKIRKRIESEQGDLAVYQERQAKAATQKAELEIQLMENKYKENFKFSHMLNLVFLQAKAGG